MKSLNEIENLYDEELCIKDWKEFLSFQSISTDPDYNQQCLDCASWLSEHLKKIGFSTELLPTDSKPVVYGEYTSKVKDAPRILFYGHYDVQPPDPLDEWTTPPFEPTIRDGRMYARGAQDNKGQVTFFIKAVEALLQNGDLPVSLALVIEGEEECGILLLKLIQLLLTHYVGRKFIILHNWEHFNL